jgi:bifunctional DNA-binding transcriptional regulator/antitoxin component of YhaV-PrlF toxin-antitoxin module
MIKTMTMTLTSKRQTVFPLEWCEREGLARGGPLSVFDLGKDGLLIRPIKAPGKETIQKLLSQTPAGSHTPSRAAAIVRRAVRQARDKAGRH